MEVVLDRDKLLNTLSHIQGIIEKRSTLPILSNVLIEAQDKSIKFTSTDLDLIFVEEIRDLNITKNGSTTISASIFYEIIRKCSSGSKINLSLISENKLELKSENSKFNLLCLPSSDFPFAQEETDVNSFSINSKLLLKLINKSKIAISNDETRHYLNGIYLHKVKTNNQIYLIAVATDSHRMSVSKIKLDKDINFEPIILPKKTIFQLSSLLVGRDEEIKISNNKTKIKFNFQDCLLISKVIDGKFPDYTQVIPKKNNKMLEISVKDFITCVDRVVAVSSDRKEGVKFDLSKTSLKLSVNNLNSGDGTEILKSNFNSEDMSISFNSSYLIEAANQIEGEKVIFALNDPGSPVIMRDPRDLDTFFIIMPMKI